MEVKVTPFVFRNENGRIMRNESAPKGLIHAGIAIRQAAQKSILTKSSRGKRKGASPAGTPPRTAKTIQSYRYLGPGSVFQFQIRGLWYVKFVSKGACHLAHKNIQDAISAVNKSDRFICLNGRGGVPSAPFKYDESRKVPSILARGGQYVTRDMGEFLEKCGATVTEQKLPGLLLRNAILWAADGNSVVIGPSDRSIGKLGAIHEFGKVGPAFRPTGKVYPPRPFMRPAFEKVKPRLPAYVAAAVRAT